MRSAAKRSLPFFLVLLTSAWLASTISVPGDWIGDSWPAVHALAQGRVSDYLAAKAIMGPFSTLVEAPFVAIGGGSGLHAYEWAAFPCLVAVGLLGLYLGRVARRHGASVPTAGLIAGLCLVNPLTFDALQYGHPEELLTAALATGAVATAAEGHRWRTAVLLGLAVASKQWAIVAVLPALMALPERRARTALAAVALAALLVLPGVLANFDSFAEVSGNVSSAGEVATPWSVWYPVVGVTTEKHRSVTVSEGRRSGLETIVARVHRTPAAVGKLSHPMIVLLGLILPLLLALRRRGFGLGGGDAMALLALLFLLRCVLDPLDNVYYHTPLLLALLGWDAFDPGRLPLRGLAGAALALLFWQWSLNLTDPAAYNLAYVVMAAAGVAVISFALFRPRRFAGYPVSFFAFTRKPKFLPDEVPLSTIKGSVRPPIRGL
jgi:Glycosyltransferase family 87